MNKSELLDDMIRLMHKLDFTIYGWSKLSNHTLGCLVSLLNELWEYRVGIIRGKDIDDSLLSDVISLCQVVVNTEKYVSQYKLAQSLLIRIGESNE